MTGTGAGEAAAILTLLASAGTVFDGVGDDTATPVDWSGGTTAYMVPLFLPPVPAARGRGLGVTEKGQPQVFPFQVTYIARTQAALREIRVAGDNALIGVVPVANNSTEIKAAGSRVPPSLDTGSTPSECRLIRYYTCMINGIVDELS